MSEPGQPTELEPVLMSGNGGLTNAQVALLAAGSRRLSIVSSDADERAVLERAGRFKHWLDYHDASEES